MNKIIVVVVSSFFVMAGCTPAKPDRHGRPEAISFHFVRIRNQPDDFTVRSAGDRETLYLEKKSQFTLADVDSVALKSLAWSQEQLSRFAVNKISPPPYEVVIRFAPQARSKLYAVTAHNLKRRLAMLVDGSFIIAPLIREPISSGQISILGRLTAEEARAVVTSITSAKRRSLVTDRDAFDRGIAYARKADYDEAIFYFTRAIEYAPKLAQAFYNRGLAYGSKGEYTSALADFTQAIEIKPSYAKAYRDRSVAYNKLKEYQKAFLDINQAIELDRKDWYAYYMRGCIYYGARAFAGAITDYSRVIKINPRCAQAYAHRGACLYLTGRFYDARLDYSQALKLTPDKAFYKDFIVAVPAKHPSDSGDEYSKILQLFGINPAVTAKN